MYTFKLIKNGEVVGYETHQQSSYYNKPQIRIFHTKLSDAAKWDIIEWRERFIEHDTKELLKKIIIMTGNKIPKWVKTSDRIPCKEEWYHVTIVTKDNLQKGDFAKFLNGKWYYNNSEEGDVITEWLEESPATPSLPVAPDWTVIRNSFFLECTAQNSIVPKVDMAPHDLFEWFKNAVSEYQSSLPVAPEKEQIIKAIADRILANRGAMDMSISQRAVNSAHTIYEQIVAPLQSQLAAANREIERLNHLLNSKS